MAIAEKERRRRQQLKQLQKLHIVANEADAAKLTLKEQKYQAITEQGYEALQACLSEEMLYVLFGGAKGGSKTGTGVRIFQHLVTNYRDGRFGVMRRNYTDLQDTTKKTFLKLFPPSLILDKRDAIWKCVNNNEIWFSSSDRSTDQNYEKIRGLELSAIFIDETSQFDEVFYELLPSLLRHDAYSLETGETLSGFCYMTSNPVPGKNWLKRNFIEEKTRVQDGTHLYIAALPDNNPLLPDRYLQRAFSRMSAPMLKMLRFGDWNVEESDFKIIVPSDLAAIFTEAKPSEDIIALGIDIGLGKPDETVVYAATRGGAFFLHSAFKEYDTMRQVELLYDICRLVHSRNGKICIDAAAIGKGVADRLQQAFHSSIDAVMFEGSAQDENYQSATGKYGNRRAQLYFHARELIQNSALALGAGSPPDITVVPDEVLYEELDNTYYKPSDGRLMIEPKDNIKKRLKRSPDRADAFVLCVSAWKQAKTTIDWVFPSSSTRSHRRSGGLQMPGD